MRPEETELGVPFMVLGVWKIIKKTTRGNFFFLLFVVVIAFSNQLTELNNFLHGI